MEVRGNNQVAGLTANRASAEVMLGRPFVICSSPAPDTFEAENVIALIKHSKLATGGKDARQADLALGIILVII